MNEKFKIDREKLKQLIHDYQSSLVSFDKSLDNAIDIIGTDVLKTAVKSYELRFFISKLICGEQINQYYTNDEYLDMLEGLSNFEAVGDMQHFLNVEADYLFNLPRENQEGFAKNFAIGNPEGTQCLLDLWQNKIRTIGIDVVRPDFEGSHYFLCLHSTADNLPAFIETLREKYSKSKCAIITFYIRL